ncbi:MAG: LysM peptidoglycan-binding domain-containing protein [Psychroflexus halocasei]
MEYLMILVFCLFTISHQAQFNPENELSKQEFHEIIQDSVKIVFEDYKKTIRLDSIWQKALSSSELFEQIHEDVTQKDLERVSIKSVETEVLKERLNRLNQKTPFHIEYNPSLEGVINYYLSRGQKSTERLISLSRFYFPLFEQTFDKYDIPLEMKYLALVESALNPRAKSRVGATGLWQFMYTTGKMYDLDVSSYVDERMDPIASTEAAAQYLKKLYTMFDDWDLALAAYNSGPGNVSKAIRRSGGEINYWKLRRFLPRETAGYVPSFQAMMYLFEYADEHNLAPNEPSHVFYATDTIRTKKLIKLEHVATATDLDLEYLKFLNPSYKLGIIPYEKDKNYYLRLPYHAVGLFVANENKIYNYAETQLAQQEEPLPKYYKADDKIRYRVRSGDYLGKIASKFGVYTSQIKRWNNLRSDRLKIGQRLTIYPKKPTAVVESSPQKEKKKQKSLKKKSSSNRSTYIVKNGDSLWSISRKFQDVTIEDIKKLNDLNTNRLKPGMTLQIRKG